MSAIPSIEEDRPASAPPAPPQLRRTLAEEFLRGSGIEIGALHLRMWLPPGASVRYVDRMIVEDLRHHYPELATLDLAPVDVVDDGERLQTVPDESVDFIVANHFLEHCQDPITTITTHLEKLRPGGTVFYAVPDKRYTFDFRRDRTPLQHVIDDHEHGPQRSRAEHYLQWASHVHEGTGPPSALQAQAYAHQLEAEDYSIHFHVWTAGDLTELILHIQDRLESFEIETVRRNGIENILVLRKHGDPAADPDPTAIAALDPAITLPDPVAPPPQPTVERTRDTIALSALRGYRWPALSDVHWSLDPDGVKGRGLVMPAAASWIVPLRLEHALTLRAQVRLLPHDWRDGTRAVRATVTMIDADGGRQELWQGVVSSLAAGGQEDGLVVDCEIPAQTRDLVLGLQAPAIRDAGSAARAVWMASAIVDPVAPADDVIAVAAAGDPSTLSASPEPTFSVLTPVHDPPLEMLREAIGSVRAQSFASWELCLVDDGSRDPAVIAALRRYAAQDSRIRLERRGTPGGISDATNAALGMATGEYVVLLDHDDLLVPNALELVAAEIVARPELDMLYSDETVVSHGARVSQILKPGWAPESLAAHMYTCHLGVYRRKIARRAGGFRTQFDGCQDYDFVLRFTELTDQVAHIPAQLYQWRAHLASTAGGGEAKPYAYLAQPRAIREHLVRRGVDADVQFGSVPGIHRIVHRVDPTLRVVVLLSPATAEEALAVARSLASQSHPTWRLRLAVPEGRGAEFTSLLSAADLAGERFDVVEHGPDSSEASDRVARLDAVARGVEADQLLLMDAPVTGLTEQWLTALAGVCAMPGIGAAGPVVLSDVGRIAEAGYALPEGIALPLMNGQKGAHAPSAALNVSAVAGALMTPAAMFADLGGLDPDSGAVALLEYCVRVGESGRRIVNVPDARLQYVRPGVGENDPPALWRLRRRWIATHAGDPLYNPNLRTDRADLSPQIRL